MWGINVLVNTLPMGAVAKYCDENVWLSVSPPGYLRNYTCNIYQFFCACCLWPWLGPPPAGWWNLEGKEQFWEFSSPLTVHCNTFAAERIILVLGQRQNKTVLVLMKLHWGKSRKNIHEFRPFLFVPQKWVRYQIFIPNPLWTWLNWYSFPQAIKCLTGIVDFFQKLSM